MNRKIFSDMKWAMISQIIIVVVSIFKTIILPREMDVESFGYWQIYLLYLSYVSIFYLGFNDGLYLRYVHLKKEEFTDKQYGLQIVLFGIVLILESLILSLTAHFLYGDTKSLVLIFVCLNIPLTGIYASVGYYLQLTGRIKKSSLLMALEKVIFCLVTLVFIFFNSVNLYYLIFTEIMAKAIILVIILYQERKTVLHFENIFKNLKETMIEFLKNINVGYKLMLGSYIALMFTGYCRIWIENTNSVVDFSYYAFALSLTNIITLVTTSLSTVIYPYMSRVVREKLSEGYMVIETYIKLFNPVIIFGYFAAVLLIYLILPSYTPSIKYLGMLFIIVMIQIKISISNGIFYKVLREEKRMVFDNVVCVCLVVIGCLVTESILSNLFVQLCVLTFRAYQTDYYFRKKLNISGWKHYFNDFSLIVIFLIIINVSYNLGLMLTVICSIVYYAFNIKYIKYGISILKQ